MLKRVVAISFIYIYLFNLVGYRLLFKYFIYQTDQQTALQLDKGTYNESELIEIKVPLNMPYYTRQSEYERFDGEIELNNTHYNFVKRKTSNDTLYLLCLPNSVKTKLHQASNEYAVNDVNDKSPTKKGTGSFEKKIGFDKEHKQQPFQFNIINILVNNCTESEYNFRLPTCFIDLPSKPPEIAS